MNVEWTEAHEGTCDRCRGWSRIARATWRRTFTSGGGARLEILYCEEHADAARAEIARALSLGA